MAVTLAEKTTVGDGRKARGEASRHAIIEAAIAGIAGQGIAGATLEVVARRAGVSKPLLLFHFGSKDGLLVAVLEHMGALYARGWDAVLASPGLAARPRLLALLEHDIGFVARERDVVAVWHAVWGDAGCSRLYRTLGTPRDRRYRNDLDGLLRELADGRDEGRVTALAKGLDAMLFGFWSQQLSDPDPRHEARAMEAVKAFLASAFPGRFPVA